MRGCHDPSDVHDPSVAVVRAVRSLARLVRFRLWHDSAASGRRRLPRQDSDVDAGWFRVQPRFHSAGFDEPHQDHDTPRPDGSLVRQCLQDEFIGIQDWRRLVDGARQGAVRLLARRGVVQRAVAGPHPALSRSRQLSGDRAAARCRARTGARYARRAFARRLHAAAGAQYSGSAGRGWGEARSGDPGNAERMPRPVGRSAGRSRQA